MASKNDFLLLTALGDSYGMKYEFLPHAQDKTADDLFHGTHAKFVEYPVGHYTDDTQMSLANLELLIAKREGAVAEFTPTLFAEKWLEAFKRDPHHGYSKYMWKVLSESETADVFMASFDASRGVTSGAAMRAGPFGLLADVEEVKALTLMQGRVTHNTTAGLNAALAVSLTVHFLHHGGARADIDGFLAKHIGADWNSVENGYDEDLSNGLNIVTSAMTSLKSADTLSGVLLHAVNSTEKSDTDTICAIAMTLASKCKDIADDLPKKLHDGLENGTYGADYLKEMDRKAAALFPATNMYAKNPAVTAKPKKKFQP